MGRGGRSRTQRKHFKQSRENVWKRPKLDPSVDSNNNDDENKSNPTWEPLRHNNAAFEEYYKEQALVPPEEWDSFMDTLRKALPAAFRINASSQFCMDIRSQLENEFMKSLQSEVIDGEEQEAIRPLPWYPENLAWHLNFSRNQLRKNQTLERFHEFLKLENEIGNITRQEAVSMVPPLFLDVRPNHFVLDMCAAPGSKTFQLLEIIHQSSKAGSLPDGLVIANDLDVQRCNLLIHQTKRMCTANLIVTNFEAQLFPNCRLKKHSSTHSEEGNELFPTLNQLLVDRVLCDVPCSGDGTLRKAPDIWRKWNAGMGNGLHSLQIQIAMRGVSLLKVGGRMVYSTCSMNPVENEAVVAEILRQCGGCVELVDVSKELPQLKRRPGLKKWKVRDRGSWLSSYRDVPEFRRNAIVPSMFPSGRKFVDQSEDDQTKLQNDSNESPVDGSQKMDGVAQAFEEEISDLPLECCMRIAPHDQNTGAFFIAVFHKLSPFPASQKTCNNLQDSVKHNNSETCENNMDDTIVDSNTSQMKQADYDEKISDTTSKVEASDEKPNAASSEPNLCDSNFGKSSETTIELGDTEKTLGKRKLQIQGKWRGVDPVIFLEDEAIISSIKAFYGIKESFPFDSHLITRNNDANSVKRIYYVSKSVKDVLKLNFQVGQQLKITSVGLKMFERQNSREGKAAPCSFRISSEGLPLILPYITKQILYATPVDFMHLLQYKSIKFSDLTDAEFSEKASNLMPGCCVIVLGKDDKALRDIDETTIAIGCWKGKASLNVMVTAMDCQEMLERLSVRGFSLVKQNSDTAGNDIEVSEKTDIDVKEEGESTVLEAES